jgi:hypothetical protein
MNVAEAKEALDDYGDHLPVVLIVTRGEREWVIREFEVETRNLNEGPVVSLEVELI